MAFNVNEFRSQMVGDGARPNLFEVSMPFPAFSGPGNAQTKLTFMCKTAQLPGATLGVVPVQYFGRELKFVGNRTPLIKGISDTSRITLWGFILKST